MYHGSSVVVRTFSAACATQDMIMNRLDLRIQHIQHLCFNNTQSPPFQAYPLNRTMCNHLLLSTLTNATLRTGPRCSLSRLQPINPSGPTRISSGNAPSVSLAWAKERERETERAPPAALGFAFPPTLVLHPCFRCLGPRPWATSLWYHSRGRIVFIKTPGGAPTTEQNVQFYF